MMRVVLPRHLKNFNDDVYRAFLTYEGFVSSQFYYDLWMMSMDRRSKFEIENKILRFHCSRKLGPILCLPAVHRESRPLKKFFARFFHLLESKPTDIPIGFSSKTVVDVFAYTFMLKPENSARLPELIYNLKKCGFNLEDIETEIPSWPKLVWVFAYIKLDARLKVKIQKKVAALVPNRLEMEMRSSAREPPDRAVLRERLEDALIR